MKTTSSAGSAPPRPFRRQGNRQGTRSQILLGAAAREHTEDVYLLDVPGVESLDPRSAEDLGPAERQVDVTEVVADDGPRRGRSVELHP